MILDDIIATKKEEVARLKTYYRIEDFKAKIETTYPPRDFTKAVSYQGGHGGVRIIAEVKRASPSRGILKKEFYPYEIAKTYQANGACAISVITDVKYFKGNLDFLVSIKIYTKVPILRKDFIIDEYQVYESRAAGADAILLIAAILDDGKLNELNDLAHALGMATLVEVHNEEELKRALAIGAEIIGINNRDLKTFETDVNTTLRLAPLVPEDRIIVSESGISTLDQIITLKEAGVSAFLIGETLIVEENIGKKLRELRGIG